MVIDDRRTWTCRYKSPVDGRMRQIKIGSWPAMAIHPAIVTWEALRDGRAAGGGPALEGKAASLEVRRESNEKRQAAHNGVVRGRKLG